MTPQPSSSSGSERMLLTNSRLQSRRRCSQEHHLRYAEGYESNGEREPLRFGHLGHLGLEAWWLARSAPGGAGYAPLEAALIAVQVARTDETDDFELVRLEELLRGYHYRWSEEPLRTLAVEREYRALLINPDTNAASKTWMLAGKMDVIAEDLRRGRQVIVEHKFTSDDITPGSVYWKVLRMDGQVSGYFRGAAAIGFSAVEACVYDVVGKVQLRQLKATPLELRRYTKATKSEPSRLYANQRDRDETIGEYRDRVREAIAANPNGHYQRGEVVRLEDEMRAHDLDVWQTATIMREERRLKIHPKNTDACRRYNSLCQFFAACSGDALITDERLYRRLDWVHPELKREVSK